MQQLTNKLGQYAVASMCLVFLSVWLSGPTAFAEEVAADPTTIAELNYDLEKRGFTTDEQKAAELERLGKNAADIVAATQSILNGLPASATNPQVNTLISGGGSGGGGGSGPMSATGALELNYPGEFNIGGMISCRESLEKDPANTVCNITRANQFIQNQDYLKLTRSSLGCTDNNIWYVPYKNGAVEGRAGEFLCLNGQGDMTYRGKFQKVSSKNGGKAMYATASDLTCDNIRNAVNGVSGTELLYYLDGTQTPPKCIPPEPGSGFGGMCPTGDPKPRLFFRINQAAIAQMSPELCQQFRIRSSINLSLLANTEFTYDSSWTNADFCSANAKGSCGLAPTNIDKVIRLGTADLCTNDAKIAETALSCVNLEDSFNKSWDCAAHFSRQIQMLCGMDAKTVSEKMCDGAGKGKGYCGWTLVDAEKGTVKPTIYDTEVGSARNIDASFVREMNRFNTTQIESCSSTPAGPFQAASQSSAKCTASNAQFAAIIAKGCKKENALYYPYASDSSKGEFLCAGTGHMTKGTSVVLLREYANASGNTNTQTPSAPATTARANIYPGISTSACRKLPESEYQNLSDTDEATQRELVKDHDANAEFCVDETGSRPHVYLPKFKHACMFQNCVSGAKLQAIRINETVTFGPSSCFDIARLENPVLNTNGQNAAIISVVKRAKELGKKDFWYCTKDNGTSPYLYIPSQQRTCLTAGDDTCYKAGN